MVGPSELLKIKKQGFEGKGLGYLNLIRKEGFKGLYAGITPTIIRDVPIYGLYFSSYEFFKKKFVPEEISVDSSNAQDRISETGSSLAPVSTKREFFGKMIAGGLAGQVSWGTGYPFDVIKSYIQYHPEHSGTLKTAKYIFQKYGANKFYKGLYP